MKRIKYKLNKLKDKIIYNINKIMQEHLIRKYIKNNILFITYVIICLVNSTLLRCFCIPTLSSFLSIKAIMGDLAVIIIVGAFGYLFKPKSRFTYYMSLTIFLSAICMINSIYYTLKGKS